ncbi:zinc finger protein 385D-like isoform X3 [Gouania willdenowi]|uniref:zinc finger protein 385D-like isoform X3 n=1 Tax=Gouania willdenowi TaxID=441366 RepID=UPI001054ED66|nr:zinc finger protein 385D-like isoform X3 [Gouania willdenowi]
MSWCHHVFWCHSVLLPLARPTLGRMQPSLEQKALLPIHLLPAFCDMDRIQKALIGPASGLTSLPLKRKYSSCRVCRLRFNSEAQASSHFSGTKHEKRLKALETSDSKIRTSEGVNKETKSQLVSSGCWQPCSSDTTPGDSSAPSPTTEMTLSSQDSSDTLNITPDQSLSPSPGTTEKETLKDGETEAPEEETEEEKAVRLLYCSLCKVSVNSASQLQAHNSGTKHKTMLEARSGEGAIKSFPRTGVKAKMAPPSETSTGLQNKTFHCEICDVHVNSETQLKQHISSRRHKDRAAGKPAKPKFSPYSPTQRHHSFQAIRLTLQKNQDLNKPLASCLLQRQLSITTAAMATMPPFSLQTLPQALLRPAPGPICSTHTSMLFSPY